MGTMPRRTRTGTARLVLLIFKGTNVLNCAMQSLRKVKSWQTDTAIRKIRMAAAVRRYGWGLVVILGEFALKLAVNRKPLSINKKDK